MVKGNLALNIANKLTSREIEVLRYLIEGKNNTQIATILFVSINTIKAHVSSIMAKFGVRSRVEVAVKAIRLNLDRL
jgi:DNA-binding NarL/FixJ family response regulator